MQHDTARSQQPMAFIHHRADGPGLQFVDGHAGKNEVERLIGEWRRERIAEPQMHRRAQMRGAGMGIAELRGRSEEHTSELQSLMRISYAVFCLKKKNS